MSEAIDIIRAELPALLKKLRPTAINLAGAQEVDDLLQETAMRMLKFAHQFQVGTNLPAWAFRIMKNEFISGKRRSRRISPTKVDDLPEEFITVGETATSTVLAAEVRTAIAGLPRPIADTIYAVCNEEMSYDEAAAKLGTQMGTIKSRLWRGRAALERAPA